MTLYVVAAVIHHNGRIYATQRGYGKYKDGWEFPGGKIEPGETPQEALKREIQEELDIDVHVEDRITVIEYDYPDFHISLDCYWASIVSGSLVLKEHEAARWLDPTQIDSVNWLPPDKVLVANYLKGYANFNL